MAQVVAQPRHLHRSKREASFTGSRSAGEHVSPDPAVGERAVDQAVAQPRHLCSGQSTGHNPSKKVDACST